MKPASETGLTARDEKKAYLYTRYSLKQSTHPLVPFHKPPRSNLWIAPFPQLRQNLLICLVKLIQINNPLLDKQLHVGYITTIATFHLAQSNTIEIKVEHINRAVATNKTGMHLPLGRKRNKISRRCKLNIDLLHFVVPLQARQTVKTHLPKSDV